MSGETEENVSAWTVDSLRTHLLGLIDEKDTRIAERDRRYEQRFESQEKAISTAMAAYATAVGLAAQRTEDEISAIRDRYDTLLGERELRYTERFEASQVAISAALAEREKAIQAALAEREKAVKAAFDAQEAAVHLALKGLREFYDVVLVERDTRYSHRIDAAEKATAVGLLGLEKDFNDRIAQFREETALAMTAAEKALDKADIANEKRFNSVNEFRAQQADIISTFARKAEVDTRMTGLTEKIDGSIAAANQVAVTSMPRAEYDRAHADLIERVVQVERSMAEKLETQNKTFESRVALLQAQLSAIEAITR